MSVTSKNSTYQAVFKDYPDILNVKQVSEILGVSSKTVYGLLRKGKLESLKVGRSFRIPKVHLMTYARIFKVSVSEPSEPLQA